MVSAKFVVAAFIGVLSFIAIAVLGIIAPAGTGVDWLMSAVGGIVMGLAAYVIIDSHSKRYRLLSSVAFGAVLVLVLVLGFLSQLEAALLTGLIGGSITYLIYPVVVGRRRLVVKLAVVSVAAAVLIAAFVVLDPVPKYVTIADVTAFSEYPDGSANPPTIKCNWVGGSLQSFSVVAGTTLDFQAIYHLQSDTFGVTDSIASASVTLYKNSDVTPGPVVDGHSTWKGVNPLSKDSYVAIGSDPGSLYKVRSGILNVYYSGPSAPSTADSPYPMVYGAPYKLAALIGAEFLSTDAHHYSCQIVSTLTITFTAPPVPPPIGGGGGPCTRCITVVKL